MIEDLKLLETVKKPNPYEKFSLLENPFPGYGDVRTDVCTNQQEIKKAFLDLLGRFGPGAKRLRITGESGAGKTNILRYFERLTEEARLRGLIGAIYPIYISAPGERYSTIHAQIVERLQEIFFTDLINTLRAQPDLKEALSEIKPAAEFLEALGPLTQRHMLFDPYEERRINALVRWLKGYKLPAQEKKFLGGPLSELNSTSLAIRFLDGLLQVLKRVELCEGVVLLFDEFEEIFEKGRLSRTQQSQYAQDLRHLFDTLQDMVLFVVATTPNPEDLGQYPAIERRLGQPLSLQPIDSEEMAIAYVRDYMRAGRERYLQRKREEGEMIPDLEPLDDLRPLDEHTVIQEYRKLKEEAEKAGKRVLPGYFLPRMRQRMQEVVERDL